MACRAQMGLRCNPELLPVPFRRVPLMIVAESIFRPPNPVLITVTVTLNPALVNG